MKTNYGDIKFYSDRTEAKQGVKRILASVDSADIKSYYSFFPDKIIKRTENSRQFIYTASYEQLPESLNDNMYQRFSPLDSLILTNGDNILSSLGLINFKRFKGAKAFTIEINYYHGYPKNKQFRP